ncbi:hypothetical protein [Streptomyces sp. enrichment culture]|uniref:hypothetical protein n=1 Tax=Streptomyces sp. enrichment culture TaxID=1795815 RepID=UPI003F563033
MTADAASPPPTQAATAALAALRDGGRATTVAARRPVRMKLDAGTYDGLSIELPGPAILAERWAAPFLAASLDVFANGSALLTRPTGSDAAPEPTPLTALVDALRDGLAALPERRDAGRPYNDLRLFVSVASPSTVTSYLADVARRVRRTAPRWSPPKADKPQPKSAKERVALSRARAKAREDESSRAWLQGMFAEEADYYGYNPGDRVPATRLYADASEAIGGWVEDRKETIKRDGPEEWEAEADEYGYPLVPRVPTSHTFYRAADDVLGPRRRVQGVRTYTIPEEPVNLTALDRAVIERAAEMIADDVRLRFAATADTSPTTVDDRPDNVIPLRRVV